MTHLNCEYHKNKLCSICNGLDKSYLQQLELKIHSLQTQLNLSTLNLVTPSSVSNFRDKAKLQVSLSNQDIKIGFLDSKKLVVENEILACPLHNNEINKIISKLPSLLQKYNITPYDIQKRSGELKNIILFYSPTTKESYLRFVCRSKESKDRLIKFLQEIPSLTCISMNVQPKPAAILEGEEELYFSKNNFITHQFNQYKFYLSPQGFVQTNTEVASKLYQTAAEWLDPLKLKSIADIFCGHGAFSFHIQNCAENILGVEVNKIAIEMAKSSQKDFGHRGKFIADKAENIESILTKFSPQAVIVNPPRAGLKKFTDVLNNLKPKYILYSSCNIISLKSDIEHLNKNYEIIKTGLFDMFPHSEHFESLILLRLRI